ncbi:MAG: redoxin family protein [Rhodopseudomonas sp.]|nr:redoxin family protein [Rhodopseudomonas sp.]
MNPFFSLSLNYSRFVAALVVVVSVAATGSFSVAQDAMRNLVLHASPKPVAQLSFGDAQGLPQHLTDYRGKVALLNVWATWCVPCRHEMPALDRLQAALGGAEFAVLPISIDRGGKDVVSKFYTEVGIHNLGMYLDSAGKATRELGVFGLPTTLLLDREGREIARLIGPAEWDAPGTVAFIKCVISRDKTARSSKEPESAETSSCGKHGDVPTSGPPGINKT